jgi:hypothetical protein
MFCFGPSLEKMLEHFKKQKKVENPIAKSNN